LLIFESLTLWYWCDQLERPCYALGGGGMEEVGGFRFPVGTAGQVIHSVSQRNSYIGL